MACAQGAVAADLAAPKPAPVPAPGFDFFTGIEYHAQGEAGILGNSLNPSQGINGAGYNFGSLYEDHANTPLLNQILLTATKVIDPKATRLCLRLHAAGPLRLGHAHEPLPGDR